MASDSSSICKGYISEIAAAKAKIDAVKAKLPALDAEVASAIASNASFAQLELLFDKKAQLNRELPTNTSTILFNAKADECAQATVEAQALFTYRTNVQNQVNVVSQKILDAERAAEAREQAAKTANNAATAEKSATKKDNAGNGQPGSASTSSADQLTGVAVTGKKVPETIPGKDGLEEVTITSKKAGQPTTASDGLDEVNVTGKRNPETPEGQLNVAEPNLIGAGDINVNPSSSIQQGLEQQAREQAAMMDATKYAQAADWRVRLSLADNANYLYKASPVGPLLAPLQATNGIIFPYTPSISVSYVANYDQSLLQHSNYKVVQYQNSAVESVTIGCDFTAQSVQEANYVLATIHFLRSVTKMFYGQDEEPIRGTPPPLCYLTGLGQYNFSAHPLVITGFTYTLPTDVDYIRAVPQDPPPKDNSQVLSSLRIGQGNQSGAAAGGLPNPPNFTPGSEPPTMVPTRINIQIQATPVVARNTISNQFSLKEYATGALLAGRKITGGGIW